MERERDERRKEDSKIEESFSFSILFPISLSAFSLSVLFDLADARLLDAIDADTRLLKAPDRIDLDSVLRLCFSFFHRDSREPIQKTMSYVTLNVFTEKCGE